MLQSPRRHGGRRPNAGAPKGNLNALKHGRFSKAHAVMLAALAQVPEAADTMIALAKKRQKQNRKVEAGAHALMADLLQRVGHLVLFPQDNQLQNNQLLLDFLYSAEADLRKIIEIQSRERLRKAVSIKKRRPRAASASRGAGPGRGSR